MAELGTVETRRSRQDDRGAQGGRVVLVEVAIVEHEQKIASVRIEALDRMWNPRCEIPQIADALRRLCCSATIEAPVGPHGLDHHHLGKVLAREEADEDPLGTAPKWGRAPHSFDWRAHK